MSDVSDHLLAMNPWKDMNWPEVVRQAAEALSSKDAEIEALRKERDEARGLIEHARDILLASHRLPHAWDIVLVAEAIVEDIGKLRWQVRDTRTRAESAEALLAEAREALKGDGECFDALADVLDGWANESRSGGWSTHQVVGNIEAANKCRRMAALARSTLSKIGDRT